MPEVDVRGLVLVSLLVLSVPSAGTAQLRVTRRATDDAAKVDPASRVLVANANVTGDCPPADAIAFSAALRTTLERLVRPRLTVIPRVTINRALEAFGFAADELLPDATTVALADGLKAGHLVTAVLSRGADGKLSAAVTVRGRSPVAAVQAGGQSTAAFGESVAEQIRASLE